MTTSRRSFLATIGPHLAAHGREESDARGLAVAPGFIDIHSHGDGNLDQDPRAESVIRQGVTTIVVGADGSSRATGAVDKTFADYFVTTDRLCAGPNVATMVGLGSVRGAVVGDKDRPATPDEIARMTAMVERALADGAGGASTGFECTPGAFASLDKLIVLSRPLASRRLPYATHMRNEDDKLLDAIDESIAVANAEGKRLGARTKAHDVEPYEYTVGPLKRSHGNITLPNAIRKMTSLSAARVHLTDRGRLATGLAADVVVVDPARITDTATCEQPFQYPVGISTVIVNGAVALRDGQRAPVGTGRALRAG